MGNLCQVKFKNPQKAQIYSAKKYIPNIAIKTGLTFNTNLQKKEQLPNHCFYLRPSFSEGIDNKSERVKLSLLTFKDGKIIESSASKGEEVLHKVLNSDEGASRIGEVALVPHSSPISQSGIIFYNTLFDENAASHIALGQCYSKCFKGDLDLSKDEITKRGGNSSMIHIDWMIGSKDIDIDGLKSDGSRTAVFRKGEWA